LIWKIEKKRIERKLGDNGKLKIKDIICKEERYIQLAPDRVKWRVLMTGVEASVTSIVVLVTQAGGIIHFCARIFRISYVST
jgi:hypothetical protein